MRSDVEIDRGLTARRVRPRWVRAVCVALAHAALAHAGLVGAAGVLLPLPARAACDPSSSPAEGCDSEPATWQPARGVLDLLLVPPMVAGSVIGAVGLTTGATLATLGDLVALGDRNDVVHGALSTPIRGAALGLSAGGTQTLEVLRQQPIERWPEGRVAYLEARPFRGRLDTLLSGGGSLRVGLADLIWGPVQGIGRLVGAQSFADAIAGHRSDLAVFYLGPGPLPNDVAPAP